MWESYSHGCYRIARVLHAAEHSFYLRIRSPRMPCEVFVVYRLCGIDSIDSWWCATGDNFEGIMTSAEADIAIEGDL